MSDSRTAIAVLGCGPRGLSVLERILAHVSEAPQRFERTIVVHVVEPGNPGEGSHKSAMPDYLLVNVPVGSTSIFSDATCVDCVPSGPGGPTMEQWAALENYNWDDSHKPRRGPGEKFAGGDFVPRWLLGRYLNWSYRKIVQGLSNRIQVIQHDTTAIDLIPRGNGVEVRLENGETFFSDYAFITTGHPRNKPTDFEQDLLRRVEHSKKKNPRLEYINDPLSVELNLKDLPPGLDVAIEGFGLTAHDLIAEFTEGRGGVFERSNGELKYHASGKEPRLLVYSLDSLPMRSRFPYVKPRAPKFLLPSEIRKVRAQGRQLDFKAEILPRILSEIQDRYYSTLFKQCYPEQTMEFEGFCRDRGIDWLDFESVARLFPEHLRFVWESFANPTSKPYNSRSEFEESLIQFMEVDIRERKNGDSSLLNAACEGMRSCLPGLRECVEDRGLTEKAHREFFADIRGVFQRYVFGPPSERIEQLLCLVKAGIVQADLGPRPDVRLDESTFRWKIQSTSFKIPHAREADVLIVGRVPLNLPLLDASPLISSLLRRGIARPFKNGDFHPGGLDVSHNGNLIDGFGRASSRFFALGPVTEGANYITNLLIYPQSNSNIANQSGRAVRELFADLSHES